MTIYVTKEELSKERTKNEFIEWIDNKFNEIGLTEEGKQAVRFKKGLC